MTHVSRYPAAILLLAGFLNSAVAQAKPDVEPPLLFRRELLPESLLSKEKGLFPIKRDEFDALLRAARSRTADAPADVWIESANYEAELIDGRLQGKGRVQIRSRTSSAALLSFAGLRLPIIHPHWGEDGDRRAVVGATSEGNLLAVVPESGVLTFDWNLMGKTDAWGASTFDLELCEASRNTISIRLPRAWKLEPSAGIVSTDASDDASTWLIQLGGRRGVRLRCSPDSPSASGPIVLVREENTCVVSLGGVEAKCDLRFDVYREPVRELEVALPGNWRPTQIQQGDFAVPFEIRNGAEGDSMAVLRFDPPLSGTNRRLTLTGRGIVNEGSRITVPRARIRDGAWLDGTVSVEGSGVQLVDWQFQGIQRASGAAGGRTGVINWSLENEEATLSFLAAPEPVNLRAEWGTTLRVDSEAVTAEVVTDFTSTGANIFHLEAEVPAAWIIDSVETLPPQSMEDWQLLPRGSRQLLHIDLNRSVSSAGDLRVVIQAHRAPPAMQEGLGGEHLRPVRWLAQQAEGNLALGIDARWQADFRGGGRLRHRDPAGLTTAESDRLQLTEDVLLLAGDDQLDSVHLTLAEESPQFSAAWRLHVAEESGVLRQETLLRIEPAGSPVERFRVLVQPGSAGKELQWQLVGDEGALDTRLVRTGEGATGEDEWELELRRARRNPFEVRATLAAKMDKRFDVRFFRCVEASSQSGFISLGQGLLTRLVVEQATGVERVWNDPQSSGNVSHWRYDPSHAAAMRLRAATASELSQLMFIESARLETRLAPSQLVHHATFRVRNEQSQTFSIRLPNNSELDHVVVQNQPADTRAAAAGQVLLIPLSQSSDLQEVRIAYRTPRLHLGAISSIAPIWPECEALVVSRSWEVVFPEQYRHFRLWSAAEHWSLSGLWRRIRGPLPGFESYRAESTAGISPGGMLQRVEFGDGTRLPSSVWLIHQGTAGALGWGALILSWTMVVMTRAAGRQSVLAVGAIAALAVSLPSAFDPIGRMLLIGASAGALSWPWTGRPIKPAAPSTSGNSLRFTLAVSRVLLLVLACMAIIPAWGQDVPKSPPIHRVVFPVDENGKPATEHVYASEGFSKELYRRGRRPALEWPAALFCNARYRATPQANAEAWDFIEAEIEVEVLKAPAAISIPWSGESLVAPQRVRVDERTTVAQWNPDADVLTVNIETEGRHTIRFNAPSATRASNRCKLRLPPAAHSELSMDSLSGGVIVQADLPSVPSSDEPGLQVVELGQHNELTLSVQPQPNSPPPITAEQLVWTSLWPGAAIVEGRWRFTSEEGRFDSVGIEVDGDLELISSGATSPAVAHWTAEESSSSLTWKSLGPSRELVVEAMFLWRSDSADRVLPRIEPANALVTRRWLAIDTAANTRLTLASPAESEQLDVEEFATLWNAEEPPQIARRLSQPGPVTLAAPVKAIPIEYDAVTNCRIGMRGTSWQWRAERLKVAVPRNQLRMSLPSNARIASVEIKIAGQTHAIPWLAAGSGEIVLLPPQPLQNGGSLVVTGEIESEEKQSMTLARLHEATPRSHHVELSRHPDVQVKDLHFDGLSHLELQATRHSDSIPLARLELNQEKPLPEPVIEWSALPNHPRTVAILVTTLRQEDAQWLVRLDAFVAVREGVVDAFRLQAGENWTPIMAANETTKVETIESSEADRLVLLRPVGETDDAPAGETRRWHLSCEGPLLDSTVRRLAIPSIRLLDAEAVQHYLRLPIGEEFNWSTSGVQEAALPSAAPLGQDFTLATYRVAVPQFRVELNNEQPTVNRPRVVWGQVVSEPRHDGTYLAQASFLLDPQGESSVPITLPPGALLVRTEVEGAAEVAQLHATRKFESPLRSATLPQMMNVVFTGPAEQTSGAGSQGIAPKIDGWEIAQSFRVFDRNDVQSQEIASAEFQASLPSLLAEHSEQNSLPREWVQAWLTRLPEQPAPGAGAEQIEELRLRLLAFAGQEATARESPGVFDRPAQLTPVSHDLRAAGYWFATLVSVIGIVLGVSALTRWDAARELCLRWPGLPAVGVGLVVAMIVSPATIGGLLMILGGASAFAWPWRVHPAYRPSQRL